MYVNVARNNNNTIKCKIIQINYEMFLCYPNIDNKKQSKQSNEYCCIERGFIAHIKCNYTSHLLTAKYIGVT